MPRRCHLLNGRGEKGLEILLNVAGSHGVTNLRGKDEEVQATAAPKHLLLDSSDRHMSFAKTNLARM